MAPRPDRRRGARRRVRPAVLAVDGGGSKVDAVLLARDGSLVAAIRFRNTDHDGTESETYLEGVAAAVEEVRRAAGLQDRALPLAGLGVYCLAGADFPADERRLARWLGKQGWTPEDVVRNDTFAVLRAGTDRGWGVGVVCGYGTNCSGVAPDGRTFRFPAVGPDVGGLGGGSDIGEMALWYALRAQDGRGEKTSLATLVPQQFGMRRPRQVMEAMYFGRLPAERVVELPPLVFRAASDGDGVARSIVDRQADEVVAMAVTALRKLRMTKLDADVVLGGGIFRNDDPDFHRRIAEGIGAVAPAARCSVWPSRRWSGRPCWGSTASGHERLRSLGPGPR